MEDRRWKMKVEINLMADEKYQKLAAHLTKVHNLTIAYRVLSWDQQVNMPPAGHAPRDAQMAHARRHRHGLVTTAPYHPPFDGDAPELSGVPLEFDPSTPR